MSSKAAQSRHDAAVLPRIRDLSASGLSLREIADQLQADCFPPPGRGAQWSHVAVKRILERVGEASTSSPGSTTLSVSGPVNVTGQVTITTAGPVNTRGPVNVTTADKPAATLPKGSTIILPATPPPFAFSPPHAVAYALPLSPDAALMLPNPLFLRRRV